MDTELWDRIELYQFDEPNTVLTLVIRLARENDWSLAYAKRVAEEYRKFCYLCVVEGPCTPSDIVDQCWHLHLIYTREYWDIWCDQVLQYKLHHGPTIGGKEEDEKFDDWYSHTLEAYQKHFSELPPEDIWPKNKQRFTTRRVTVDVSKYLVIKVSDYPIICLLMVGLLRVMNRTKKCWKKINQNNFQNNSL